MQKDRPWNEIYVYKNIITAYWDLFTNFLNMIFIIWLFLFLLMAESEAIVYGNKVQFTSAHSVISRFNGRVNW